MKTSERSTIAQQIIKDRLGSYFSEEQLSYLDDLGIEILSDYFSNRELRDLQDAQPAVIKGFVDRNQGDEVRRRLTHITVEELKTLRSWYKDNCLEVEEVVDPQSEEVIALEVKHKTLKNSTKVHWDGRFIVAVGDRLAATRTRLDGVVGYQSAMLVQDPEFVEKWSAFYKLREEKFAAHMKKVDKAKAAHAKRYKAANDKYLKEMDKYNDETAKQVVGPKSSKNKKLVMPVFEEPVYEGVGEFEEPERPTYEQFLPPTDTRWSEPEMEVIDEEHIMSSISKSDIISVKRHIEATGYKKPVSKIKEGYKVDGFILRKVK